MEDKLIFGKFVAKKRKESQLTQKDLAEKLFVTESAVSKWERGISYPDITFVSALCRALSVSEHELITASEDHHQHEVEMESDKYRKLVKIYLYTFLFMYSAGLLTCFICNLAVSHTLSWFFIVLFSITTSFSLTTLPVLLNKNRGLITLGSFFISLNLLLLICAIFTSGNWFGITFISILFGFSVVFLPIVLYHIRLPRVISSHKALISIFVDSILLLAVIIAACVYRDLTDRIATVAIPITLISLVLPWVFLLVIRYVPINSLYKTSICLVMMGIYTGIINSVTTVISEHTVFSMPEFDYSNWSGEYINGNVLYITCATFIFLAVVFAIGGMVQQIKGKQKD